MDVINSNTLIITNGDSAVHIMQEAGIAAEFLPWRDVLHDGPVPSDLSLAELSAIRADFICAQGWGDSDNIKRDFKERDEILESFRQYEKILLWFEHDLYDQLQILQILDWFSHQELGEVELTMICTEQYLGECSVDDMKDLLQYEMPVTQEQLTLAKQAWASFRSSTPEAWRDLLGKDTTVLPFLRDAVLRLLQEYPANTNGLGLTARKALRIIADGETNLWQIFSQYQQTEARRYLGDSSFWAMLNEMIHSEPPCLLLAEGEQINPPVERDSHVEITQTGLDLIAGKHNWLDLYPQDKWIGGVHITNKNRWIWDDDSKRFT